MTNSEKDFLKTIMINIIGVDKDNKPFCCKDRCFEHKCKFYNCEKGSADNCDILTEKWLNKEGVAYADIIRSIFDRELIELFVKYDLSNIFLEDKELEFRNWLKWMFDQK